MSDAKIQWIAAARRAMLRRIRPAASAVGFAVLALAALMGMVAPVGAARADGGAPNLVYVAGAGQHGDDLAILDIASRKVTGHVHLSGTPTSVVLSFDARYAYVTEATANQLAVVDTRTLQVAATVAAGRHPQAVVLTSSGSVNALFITARDSNAVVIINADTRRPLATVPVGAQPLGEALAAQGSGINDPDINDAELYIANSGSDSVSVISTDRRRMIATIPIPGSPIDVAIPPTGGVAYVTTQTGAILALSLARHTVLGTLFQLPGGHTPGDQMDYNAVTGQISVPDPAGNVVYILRPASAGDAGQSPSLPAEPARALPISGGPAAVAITFDGAYTFVTQRDTGHVAMIDTPTRQVLATISVGGTPHGLVTGAYPPPVDRQTANIGAIIVIVLIVLVLAGGGFAVVRSARAERKSASTREKH